MLCWQVDARRTKQFNALRFSPQLDPDEARFNGLRSAERESIQVCETLPDLLQVGGKGARRLQPFRIRRAAGFQREPCQRSLAIVDEIQIVTEMGSSAGEDSVDDHTASLGFINGLLEIPIKAWFGIDNSMEKINAV